MNNESNHSFFFKDLEKEKLLTQEEEKVLIRRIKAGDQKAMDKLILSNLRFVISVARQYLGRGLSLMELISEGTLGLYKAGKRFDPSHEVKFISYAVWWVKQTIQKAIFNQIGAVPIPSNKLSLFRKFQRELFINHGDYKKTIEMEVFQDHERDIVEVMDKLIDTSLDAPIRNAGADAGAASTLLDIIGVPEEQHLDHEKGVLTGAIDRILAKLDDMEEQVLRMYYGISYTRQFTLEEIGSEFKITRERVRQIKKSALRRLFRLKEAKRELLPFFSEGEEEMPF